MVERQRAGQRVQMPGAEHLRREDAREPGVVEIGHQRIVDHASGVEHAAQWGPEPGGKRNSCLYRVAEDPDHRFALYVNSSFGNYGTPAHNHTTWAVIVGVTGEELNRFYDRRDGRPIEKSQYVVKQGTGVCFMPEDLHSIHIAAPLINFHMYGLALEQLHNREYYKAEERAWKVFPPHSDIREARA